MREPSTSVDLSNGYLPGDASGVCARQLCSVLAGGSPAKRHKLLQRGERLDLAGGACRKIWIILNGSAAICTGLPDGRRQILALETPGSIVCGMATGHQSGSWVEALATTRLCELDLSSAMETYGRCGASNNQLIAELFSIMHERLETCSAHLLTLGRLDSTERVALFLVDLAQRIGRPCGDSVFVELPMTREDIADYLGLNTETISRIFTRLKKSRLVQFPSRSSFSIPDLEALQRRLPVTVKPSSGSQAVDSFLSAFQAPTLAQDGAQL